MEEIPAPDGELRAAHGASLRQQQPQSQQGLSCEFLPRACPQQPKGLSLGSTSSKSHHFYTVKLRIKSSTYEPLEEKTTFKP